MLTDPALATAADYADALIVARRAKNLILLVILLALLVELALFFVARYTNTIIPSPIGADATAITLPTTVPAAHSINWADVGQYSTGLAIFLSLLLTIVLGTVLYLITKIMLVGRLIGVARLTSAFVLSIVLLVLLFPWQSFLAGAAFSDPSFKPPGVLYTWSELTAAGNTGAKFSTTVMSVAILKWARYVAFPVLAIIIALMIQVKSNRGLRQALGEETALGNVNPLGTEPLP